MSNYIKISVFILTTVFAGCATSGGGQNAVSAVENSLATVEQAAQTGQQSIESGVAATKNINANQLSLPQILADQLDVSQQQALGGAGAIFQAAKGNMEPQAFTTLSQSIPGMGNMLSAAPSIPDSMSNVTEDISSMVGGAGDTLGSATSLIASFKQLNLSPDMVSQFIPIMTDYVRTNGGQVMANLLQSALTAP